MRVRTNVASGPDGISAIKSGSLDTATEIFAS